MLWNLSLWLLWHRKFGSGWMGWCMEVSLLILNKCSRKWVFLLMSLEGPLRDWLSCKEPYIWRSPIIMAATPPPHTYKVNCDAFVDKKHEWISLGIVARDYEGFVLAGPRTTRNFLFEPVVVEALAVLHAMELSKYNSEGWCPSNCQGD